MKIKTIVKIITIGILCLALIIGGAITFLIATVDQETIKKKASQLVHDKTGRELTIRGKINWTFFPWLGIKIQQVSLSDNPAFSNPYFAMAREVGVNLKLLSLLSGHLEIGHLTLKDFELQLTKNRAGKNNWQDLLALNNSITPTTIHGPSRINLATFTIENIAITNGKLTWQDQPANQTIKLHHFNLRCRDIVVDQKIKAIGEITIGSVQFNKLAITNFTTTFRSNQKGIDCPNLSFDCYQGKVSGKTNLDLTATKPKVNITLAIEHLALQMLLNDLANYHQFQGSLQLTANLQLSGDSKKTCLASLDGAGKMIINQGLYVGTDIPYEIRRVHAIINMQPTPAKPYPPHTDFDQLTLDFNLAKGVLTTNNLLIQAPDYKVTGQGSANLATEYLNLSLSAYSTHDENFFVPVKISGAFTDPSIRFDAAVMLGHTIKRLMKKVVQKQLEKQLQNLPQQLEKVLPLDKLFH